MEDMTKEVAEGKFIESAIFSGNMYGTSIAAVSDVAATGRRCLLDIDLQGVQAVKKTDLNARFLFIAPPSMTALEERLRGRGTETEEAIQARLEAANREMAYAKTPGVHDRIIVNDDVDKAYKELEKFIYEEKDEA